MSDDSIFQPTQSVKPSSLSTESGTQGPPIRKAFVEKAEECPAARLNPLRIMESPSPNAPNPLSLNVEFGAGENRADGMKMKIKLDTLNNFAVLEPQDTCREGK